MKIKVNGTEYDVEIFGNRSVVNDKEILLEIKNDVIIIGDKEFYLDFYEESGESSLLIVNGMAFVVSTQYSEDRIIKEIKAPMSGEVADLLVEVKSKIDKGQGLVILQAMKMYNEVKSPVNGTIKDILVQKRQAVKSGETMIILE
jgi:biotin carboxyl carrier protein